MTRLKGIRIQVPVKELEKEDVYSKVEEVLSNDPENAYTVKGVMVVAFGVKPEDIYKSFAEWKKGLSALYGRIDRCLRKLNEEGKVNQKKYGKAWVYWHKKNQFKVQVKDIER
jgi:hypothetical protein